MEFDILVDDEQRPIMLREVFGFEVTARGVDRKPHVALVRLQPDMSTFSYEMVSSGEGKTWQLLHEGLIRLPPKLVPGAAIQWLSDGELGYQIVEVVNLLEEK